MLHYYGMGFINKLSAFETFLKFTALVSRSCEMTNTKHDILKCFDDKTFPVKQRENILLRTFEAELIKEDGGWLCS